MSLYTANRSSVLIPMRSGKHDYNIVMSEDLGDYLAQRKSQLKGYVAVTLGCNYQPKLEIIGVRNYRYVCSKNFSLP